MRLTAPRVRRSDDGGLSSRGATRRWRPRFADVLAGRRRTDLQAARAYAAEFTPERAADVYAAAYRSLVRTPVAQ